MTTKPCWKTALLVLTLVGVLYCLPSILLGENDVITPAAEDVDATSDLLTITTYYLGGTGYDEGHLITFPDGTKMTIDCGYEQATADITTISHFHDDHCGGCGAGDYHRNNVFPGQIIPSSDGVTVTVVAANGRVLGQGPAGPYGCGADGENPLSMALWVKYGGFDYLTTGDLYGYVEGPLGIALRERGINIDVLKVSHHGTSTNGTSALSYLENVSPEYATISGRATDPLSGDGSTIPNLIEAGVRTIYCIPDYKLPAPAPTEVCTVNGTLTITTDGYTYTFYGPGFSHGPYPVDDGPSPTPTETPTGTPTWDPSVPTYTPTATPTPRPEGPWPMFRYDAAGTGQSRYFVGPQTGQLAWSYVTRGYIDANPVVGFDGRVCVGSNDNRFYALTSSGALIWSYLTGGDFISAAAISSDWTVHIGAGDGSFYAFTSAGSILWTYGTGGGIRSSAVIDLAGKIYVGSDDNMVYAFSSDGRLEWSYDTGGNASSSPVLGSDGSIYTGSEDNVLYALSTEGSFMWSYSIGYSLFDWGTLASSPVIKPDGSICVGSGDGRIYAFSSTGAFLWRYVTTRDLPVAPPVIDHSGNIYVGAVNARFYELTPTGKCRWSYWINDSVSSAAIDASGNIYVGAYFYRAYALTSTGCLTWSYRTGGLVRSSPAIGCAGYVYVGSRDNRFYAFKDPPTPTPTPTNTPTPTGTPTVTQTPTPTTPPTATIPPLVVLPGALAAGRDFSVSLALTKDITQPFDFYLFVDTPAGPYTLYLDGRVRKGITSLYRNVKCLTEDYITTVRPSAKVPAGMTGKTVAFYAAFIETGKKPTISRVSDVTPSTPHIILMDKASATINP